MPSVPPAAIVPRNSGSLYPCRRTSGSAIVPIVAAVATLEPDVAANMAHEPMLECISPPGSQESHCASAAYIRAAMPERSSSSPSRMNIGIAMSRKSVPYCQKESPMARCRGMME